MTCGGCDREQARWSRSLRSTSYHDGRLDRTEDQIELWERFTESDTERRAENLFIPPVLPLDMPLNLSRSAGVVGLYNDIEKINVSSYG